MWLGLGGKRGGKGKKEGKGTERERTSVANTSVRKADLLQASRVWKRGGEEKRVGGKKGTSLPPAGGREKKGKKKGWGGEGKKGGEGSPNYS